MVERDEGDDANGEGGDRAGGSLSQHAYSVMVVITIGNPGLGWRWRVCTIAIACGVLNLRDALLQVVPGLAGRELTYP